MQSRRDQETYKGLLIRDYPLPKNRPCVEHRFDVYTNDHHLFSVIESITDERVRLPSLPIDNPNEVVQKQGRIHVHQEIDQQSYIEGKVIEYLLMAVAPNDPVRRVIDETNQPSSSPP